MRFFRTLEEKVLDVCGYIIGLFLLLGAVVVPVTIVVGCFKLLMSWIGG